MQVNSSNNARGGNISAPPRTQSVTNTQMSQRRGGRVSKVWEHYAKIENDTKCKSDY